MPKEEKISCWSAENCWSARDSAGRLRETLMSTMLPLWMSGGRRMEGNSIWRYTCQLEEVGVFRGVYKGSRGVCLR